MVELRKVDKARSSSSGKKSKSKPKKGVKKTKKLPIEMNVREFKEYM
jgi:hypothetical protein